MLSIINQTRLCLALRITKLKNPKFRGRIYSAKLEKLTSHLMKFNFDKFSSNSNYNPSEGGEGIFDWGKFEIDSVEIV